MQGFFVYCIFAVSLVSVTGSTVCDENAETYIIGGETECFCKDGYYGNGTTCTDINECLNSCACSDGLTCINTPGSFECKSPAPVNPCDENAESHIINGTVECFCKDGYFGDGENCSDIDECLNSCACPVGQQCRNKPGYHECIRPGK
ncbi:adhesion G protein-coupled receptor L4-like [Xenia sp. Carnegie-2017]|uniref:adhesion G protein-coupled receptor L4-like n=1 Tax=Xenia sp. Carnegie-2017 TaxID=2897299 RepID=UPI001F04DCBE|nr:adhesion G protein-coupled receptor L4-like [Xenia sp. Carnegie-2017]